MAVCLDYQTIYLPRRKLKVSVRYQLALATILVVMLVAKVWIRIQETDYGYRLAKVQSETVALDMERREVELRLSVLRRHDNLLRNAKEKLQLHPLHSSQAWKIQE